MAEGSGCSATIDFSAVQLIIPNLSDYLMLNTVPGGTTRNWESYGEKIQISQHHDIRKNILADPQTSGGLLIAVKKEGIYKLQQLFIEYGLEAFINPIGIITKKGKFVVTVE